MGAKRPDGSSAKTVRVTFTKSDAERIAKVVRRIEQGDRVSRGPSWIPRMEGGGSGGGGGVTIRLGRVTGDWLKETIADIDIWEYGTALNEQPIITGDKIFDVINKLFDVAAGSFVFIAQAGNGRWYLVSPGIGGGYGSVGPTVGGHLLSAVAGYDPAGLQVLAHSGGNLQWVDVDQCA